MDISGQTGNGRNTLAVVLIVLVVSSCLALYWLSKTWADSRDNDTLCSAASPPVEHWIVLLDATDQPTPQQFRVITVEVLGLARQMPVDQRLSVMAIHPDAGELNPVQVLFSKCKPPDGEGMNSLYQAPQLAERRYFSRFHEPLLVAIEMVGQLTPTETSPILEAVYLICKEAWRDLPVTKLLMVSDLMQNSGLLSFYRERVDYRQLQKRKSYVTENAFLNGVDIRLLHLSRKGNKPQQSQRFWQQYFEEAGAVYGTPRTM
jgi:hypothetical protein